MDEQQRLLERLPDYLNGHVVGADAVQIAALLDSDAAWQAQAALMADVKLAVDAELAQMDGTRGLDTLRLRIRADAVPARPVPRSGWWQRLFDRPWVVQGAMATLALVCGAQGWMLARQAATDTAPRADVAWRAAPLSIAAPGANLRVSFAADASLEQVEAALAHAHARLVAGPVVPHAYLLQADDVPAALAQLRASAIVRAADRVYTPAAP